MRPSIIPETFVVLLCLILGTGCYYITEGSQLFSVYSRGVEIEKVLEDGQVPADEEQLLRNVQKIRIFAVKTLGLRDNDNYTKYIRMEQDYLATIVSACSMDRFEQYYWDYIFMGKLPYKGFFEMDDAVQEVARIKALGYDVYVRNVDAFSTLGFFSDPVFSFMKGYSLSTLANLLFHEQVHATFYFKADVDFSENIASFIGDEGALIYLEAEFGKDNPVFTILENENHDHAVFKDLITQLHQELKALYDLELPKEECLAEKNTSIHAWKERFSSQYDKLFRTQMYKRMPEININNAFIMTFLNYTGNLDEIRKLYHSTGSDLIAFIKMIGSIPVDETRPLERLRELAGKLSRENSLQSEQKD
ncbi:MAG: aminopeptidase [Spirochaetaceae bacterium]|nr:MAG: aminopeptidase [Spirochaetaceae bacterium]